MDPNPDIGRAGWDAVASDPKLKVVPRRDMELLPELKCGKDPEGKWGNEPELKAGALPPELKCGRDPEGK